MQCTRRFARFTRSTFRESAGPSTRAFHAPASYELSPPTPAPNTSDPQANERISELVAILNSDRAPRAQIWKIYQDTLHFLGHRHTLALEIHQRVLRSITPNLVSIRFRLAHFYANGKHMHEEKFQDIIYNIRSSGTQPDLADYHYIMAQFAAAGCYGASLEVLKEMANVGVTPTQLSYSLCLQSIAHRLVTKTRAEDVEELQENTKTACIDVMQLMEDAGVAFNSVIMDLTVRILRENMDIETFEGVLKRAYGIDLNFPDRPIALQYAENGKAIPRAPVTQFSTHALNTVIDTLGRLGETSKMIQAFEVLTQPLPPQASQYFASSFDAEDDFGVSVPVPELNYTLPHAEPNTTTYNFIIRWLCRLKRADVAKYYILALEQAEREANEPLLAALHDIQGRTLSPDIPAQKLAICQQALLPMFGYSNKYKDIEGMMFIAHITRQAAAFKSFVLKRLSLPLSAGCLKLPKAIQRTPYFYGYNPGVENPIVNLDPDALPDRTPPEPLDIHLDRPREEIKHLPHHKTLDIDRHIKTLVRDLANLLHFHDRVQSAIQRKQTEAKERMGRRVWAAKDVYYGTEKARIVVSREHWAETVHFPEPYEPRKQGRMDHSFTLPADAPGGERIFGIEPFETGLERERRDPLRLCARLYEISLEEHLARRRGFDVRPASEEEEEEEEERGP